MLMGTIAGTPELSETQRDHVDQLTFYLTVAESWTARSGRTGMRTEVVECRLFGVRARGLASHLTEGKQLYVEGKLRLDVVVVDARPTSKFHVEVGNVEFLFRVREQQAEGA